MIPKDLLEDCFIDQEDGLKKLLTWFLNLVMEVAAFEVKHLDCAGGCLHIVNGKDGKQRTAVLPKPVLDALDAHLSIINY